MNYFQTFIFCFLLTTAWSQVDQGTLNYSGRVFRAFHPDGNVYEIPYDQQKSEFVEANIYFDSTNTHVDAVVSIVYSLQVTHQRTNEFVLSFEKLGSEKIAEAVVYDDYEVYVFDSLELNFDTSRQIAGFTSHLANFECGGVPYEVWFSEELNIGPNLLTIPDEIPGTPLEFTLMTDIADIRYTATSFLPFAPNSDRFKMMLPANVELTTESPFPIGRHKFADEMKVEKGIHNQLQEEIPPPPPPVRLDKE